MSEADTIGAYSESERNLRIRGDTQAMYSAPRIDFARWTLDAIEWAGDEVLLDIGADGGRCYARLMQAQPDIAYFALDLSPELLRNHPGSDCLTRGDAMRLPYGDDSFDIVMANHVLYQLSDIEAGLAEIKRVLKPDGRLLAAADSLQNLPELQVLMRRAIVLLSKNGVQLNSPGLPSDAFALENGTRILARHFYAVVRHDLPGQLVFDDVEPALEFLESMREMRQAALPDDVSWDDLMLIMRQQMSQLLQLLGKLELSLALGALVASDSGDFIHEFVARSHAESSANLKL